MLLTLSLRDFVIVENLNLDFQSGFTVLTGETGAGKSITLDAIGLLLGDKADYSQVRHGAKEAQLSALFDISHLPVLKEELHDQGLLDDGEEELSIRRIIDAKGKSRSFINNQAATLALFDFSQLLWQFFRFDTVFPRHSHQLAHTLLLSRQFIGIDVAASGHIAHIGTDFAQFGFDTRQHIQALGKTRLDVLQIGQ